MNWVSLESSLIRRAKEGLYTESSNWNYKIILHTRYNLRQHFTHLNVILYLLYLTDHTIKCVILAKGGTIFTSLCVYSACMYNGERQNMSLPRSGSLISNHSLCALNIAYLLCWPQMFMQLWIVSFEQTLPVLQAVGSKWITDPRNWDLDPVSYPTDLFNCAHEHTCCDMVTELWHADK
jgi:hypothetical protein